jgi:hypothetical protein
MKRLACLQPALILLIAILPAILSAQDHDAKTKVLKDTKELKPLDIPAMTAELKRLTAKCDELKLEEEAIVCRNWMPMARTDQSLLYLPVEHLADKPNNPNRAAWLLHFGNARRRHAEYWFAEAKLAAEKGEDSEGYRMLWHVLRENPDHAEARRVLGRLASSTINPRPQVRSSSAKHARFGWPGKSYTNVESAHFLLTSRATTKETIELAIKLEQFYALWTQYFYPLWSPPGLLKARLKGSAAPFEKQRQIRVYLLKDKQDYVQALGTKEANIGVSVGYYNPDDETSYFFPSENIEETLYHELTHQLLTESTRISPESKVGSKRDFWLIEGIAIYMESLYRGPDYWTLGGWESPRLQTARYRAIRDGAWIPWDDFSGGTIDQWKADPNIARLYSQAAGVSHLILDPALDDARKAKYLKSLVTVYQDEPDSSDILKLLDGENAQQTYETGLTVTDQHLASLRPGRFLQELVLAGSHLNSQSWQTVMSQHRLQWLDLSFTNATSNDLESIDKLTELERLSLEGSLVDNSVIDKVSKLSKLEELDLTGCVIDDQSIAGLSNHSTIQVLWLGKTQVTEACLPTLAKMPKLKQVDVSETKISNESWRDFVRKYPRFGDGK